MSNGTPPPPPPPLPPIPQCDSNIVGATTKEIKFSECLWAADYPEIQKACYFAKVCQHYPPKALRLQLIDPILQVGPTCGLTALSMIFDGCPTAETLLRRVIVKKYSNNGEMFSAKQLDDTLSDIIEEKLLENADEVRNLKHILLRGFLEDPNIELKLKLGSLLLVAYDPDGKHAPCLKSGHKAHWALIVGFLIDYYDEFYVIARHGKTKNLAVWRLRDLARSNSNLVEFAQPVGHPDEVFVLPDGGIGGPNGLKNMFIVIDGFKAKDEIII